ncbi:MAG: metal-dependent hydrolase [Bacteroidetes bacterium]|nr:metal-dependent hydrolase [Bacteroidota bacterium]
MFIGHFGAGFAGKKITHKPSLGTLFLAAQFIDLIWPVLLLLGIERVEIDPGNTALTPLNFIHYPVSHSLFGVLIWGILFGIIYYLIKKDLKSSIVLGILVLSHWILDLFVHRPDLPLIPLNELKVGMGLWNQPFISIVFELIIFSAGIYFYIKSTEAKNKTGNYSLVGLIIFLLLIFISNLFGPPPPSVEAIAVLGNLQWLIVLWGYWIDRNRDVL